MCREKGQPASALINCSFVEIQVGTVERRITYSEGGWINQACAEGLTSGQFAKHSQACLLISRRILPLGFSIEFFPSISPHRRMSKRERLTWLDSNCT
jgi:hypothetical protein